MNTQRFLQEIEAYRTEKGFNDVDYLSFYDLKEITKRIERIPPTSGVHGVDPWYPRFVNVPPTIYRHYNIDNNAIVNSSNRIEVAPSGNVRIYASDSYETTLPTIHREPEYPVEGVFNTLDLQDEQTEHYLAEIRKWKEQIAAKEKANKSRWGKFKYSLSTLDKWDYILMSTTVFIIVFLIPFVCHKYNLHILFQITATIGISFFLGGWMARLKQWLIRKGYVK